MAVILTVAAMVAFGFYARSLEHRSILALAADEAMVEREGKLAPVKNQGTATFAAGGRSKPTCLLPIYGSSELVSEHGLYSTVSCDKLVSRSAHGVHGLPGRQGKPRA